MLMESFITPNPDLFERMHQRLMVVTAPAGYGKTVFVQEWCCRQPFGHVWFTLTEADRNPERFWNHMMDVIVQNFEISQDIRKPSTIQESGILVLDNFDWLSNQYHCEMMRRIMEVLPSSVKVILISRYWLTLDTKFGQITAKDLRFDHHQSRIFFEKGVGGPLSEDEFGSLHFWTKGWAGGMRLFLLAIEDCGSIQRFLEHSKGSHPYITDYFIDEVWNKESYKIHELLMQTAIVEGLDCSFDTVIADSDDQEEEWLSSLLSRNLFIFPHRDGTYRFEPLFHIFVQRQLNKIPSGKRRKCYSRISHWYEDHKEGTKAIDFALKADDKNRAVSMIIRFVSDLLKEGDWETIKQWQTHLGKVRGSKRAQLLLFYCWVYFLKGAFAGLDEWFRLTERSIQTARLPRVYEGELELLRSFTAYAIKDVEGAIQKAERAYPCFVDKGVYLQMNIKLNTSEAQITRGIIGLNGRLSEGYRYFKYFLSRRFPVSEMMVGYGCVACAEMLTEFYRVPDARKFARKALEVGKKLREASLIVPAAIIHSRIFMIQGKVEKAFGVVREVKLMIEDQDFWKRLVVSQQVRLYLDHGDLSSAQHLFFKEVLQVKNAPEPMHEFENLTYARILIAARAYEQVELFLNQLLLVAEGEDRLGTRIEILILEAIIFKKTDRLQEGVEALTEAVGLAAEQGYVHAFLSGGEPILELLKRVNPKDSSYSTELLALLRREMMPLSDGPHLTNRESEVLHMMEEGITNKEIALRLNVTVGTVKGYGVTLFKKLGVSNRTQAAARGKELNLIGNNDQNT